ncbi:Orf94 [Heliothis zea nudivirus]|uniref:Uncharacterized protein n=2 Tax=Betanudivirus hezeae TaxID=3052000 RepID=G9I074_HZNV2|nr:Orf94 [Heliothis zea nudivirus]YP_004956796.1 orf48 gene product [Helicoverpa zea nudivirus 2]AAN04388.1 Orf94 [Heliothis zea nudivirus]AEW69597.1 hypothetical protein Hz2V048 [Helicoverpa zea nudivirus 2]
MPMDLEFVKPDNVKSIATIALRHARKCTDTILLHVSNVPERTKLCPSSMYIRMYPSNNGYRTLGTTIKKLIKTTQQQQHYNVIILDTNKSQVLGSKIEKFHDACALSNVVSKITYIVTGF